MAQEQNWWEAYPEAGQSAPSQGVATGPLASPPARPEKAPEPKTSYRTLTPEEIKQRNLNPARSYQVSSEGKVDDLGEVAPSGNGAKNSAKVATLNSIVEQINRVQDLYNSGIKDENLTNLFGLADSIGPEAGRFDSAGQGMADQGLAAFRTPGQGAQSDMEAKQFAQANTPQSGNWDASIEEKMANLRRRVDANRAAMGLPPANWVGLDAAPKRDDNLPPPPALGGAIPPVGPSAGRDGMPTAGAGDGGGETLAKADTVQRDNPALAGVREEYKRRLGAGQTAEQIIAWAKTVGIDPSTYPSIQAQVEDFKRTRRPVSDYNTSELDDQMVPLSAADNALNAVGQSPAGAFGIAAGDAASMGTLDNIVGMTGGNAERARLGMEQVANENPVSSTLGTLAGGVSTAVGVEGMLGLAGRGVSGMARSLTADTLYGAGSGAGMTDYGADGAPSTMRDRFTGAAKGGAVGLTGSYVGGKIGGGLASMARGVTSPSVRALEGEGIPMTIGQIFGQSGKVGTALKGVEDRIAGLPVIGDIVNARRMEGVEKWNSKRFDEALKPIGASVGDKFGEEAVAEAQGLVSDAYSAALKGKFVLPDGDFANDMSQALTKAASIPRAGEEVMSSIVDILRPYDSMPNLSGEAMQTISQELRQLKAGYKNDPLKKRIGSAIDDAEASIFGMFKRQTPEVVPAYEKANTAYRRLSILQDAVVKANNRSGVFTPGQLGMADVANTVKFSGKNAAARGDRPFFDSQRAAQKVLPNTVPDSGTAGRVLIPALALGAGGASDATGATNGAGLTMGAVLAGAYSRAGQRLLTKAGRGMKGKTGRILESERTQRAIGAAGASGAVAALPNQR